jgi:hypothetical protein
MAQNAGTHEKLPAQGRISALAGVAILAISGKMLGSPPAMLAQHAGRHATNHFDHRLCVRPESTSIPVNRNTIKYG